MTNARFILGAILAAHGVLAGAVEIRRIDQAVSVQVFDQDQIETISTSAKNPSLLAISSDRGEVALLDKTTLSLQWRFYVGESEASVQFSHDGRLLAAVGGCFLHVLNVLDGTPVRSIDLDLLPDRASSHRPECNINYFGSTDIVFEKNDTILYIAQMDRVVKVDLLLGKIVTVFGGGFDKFWRVYDIRLSDNEKFLYVLDQKDYCVFNAVNGELAFKRRLSEVPDLPVQELGRSALSRDGMYSVIVSGFYVYVVDNIRGQIERRLFAAADRISALEFSDDLTAFMLSSSDGSSRIYNIATGLEEYRLDDNRASSDRVAFSVIAASNKFEVFYTGDVEGRAWFWNL